MTAPGHIEKHAKLAKRRGDLGRESAAIEEDVQVYGVAMNSLGDLPFCMMEIVQLLRAIGYETLDCIVICGL
jgi:hypothetical protein